MNTECMHSIIFSQVLSAVSSQKRVDPPLLKFIDDIFTSAMYMNYIKVNI